jgi:hypothetical protein
MEMSFVLGLFLIAIGVFLSSLEEKKVRNGNLISCTDRDNPHVWGLNAAGELECRVCYKNPGLLSDEENK